MPLAFLVKIEHGTNQGGYMSEWIDFRKLRRELNFEKVLTGYGVTLNIRETEKGEQHTSPCPLPSCSKKASTRKVFSANITNGIWQCFSCRSKGNMLDFIAVMEGLDTSSGQDMRKAALIATETFLGEDKASKKEEAHPELPIETVEEEYIETRINAPLDFTLKSLDPNHPWFAEQGLSKETVKHFGLGYCSKGWLKGRIAIPLHDAEGRLIGYAGRLLDEKESTANNPLYLFPSSRVHKGIRYEFAYSEILYTSAIKKEMKLKAFIAPSIEEVWWLWQQGKFAVCIVSSLFNP